MTATQKKPTWIDLKRQLIELDRPALLGLIQDVYSTSKDNQAFLHARFALGEDVLEPYKAIIDRWVCPDVMRNQVISVAKGKKAISDYGQLEATIRRFDPTLAGGFAARPHRGMTENMLTSPGIDHP